MKSLVRHAAPLRPLVGGLLFFMGLLTFVTPANLLAQRATKLEVNQLPLEKVYLHLDKAYYTVGETLWFKAYLVDGRTQMPDTESEVVHVNLIDPDQEIVATKVLRITQGGGHNHFKLPPQLKSGHYNIRAYTHYMQNFGQQLFFEKSIYINASKQAVSQARRPTPKELQEGQPDVQFFPEGGHLVQGLVNPVAFKGLDASGKGWQVSGKVLDNQGQTVTDFSASHLGMGLFHFIPVKNKSYRAVVEHNGKTWEYPLPRAKPQGVLMTTSDHGKHYKIELRSTSVPIENYQLLVKQRGNDGMEVPIKPMKGEKAAVVKLDKDVLQEGIAQITLVSASGMPLAERLVFHQGQDVVETVSLTSPKELYGPKDKVRLEVSLPDGFGNPEDFAHLSLGVTHSAMTPSFTQAVDLKTYLLLHSELRGAIEHPGYYFHSQDVDRLKNLDLLMRTQGWRQYKLLDAVAKGQKGYVPEKGIGIRGKVIDPYKKDESVEGSVSLTLNNSEGMVKYTTRTDNKGYFRFEDLDLQDTTELLINAKVARIKKDKKRQPVDIYEIVLEEPTGPIRKGGHGNTIGLTDTQEAKDLSNLALMEMGSAIQLEEVQVMAPEKKDEWELKEEYYQSKRVGALYRNPSHTLDFDDPTIIAMPNLNPLQVLQGRVPGVVVRGDYVYVRGNTSLGNNAALVLVDGFPIDPQGFFLPPQEIDFIDVLKGPDTGIFGLRGGNGVVAIYTKTGLAIKNKPTGRRGGSLTTEHPGFAQSKTFYTPKYPNAGTSHNTLKASTTLYWEPNIGLDSEGKATIAFPTAELPGEYRVRLEGISSTGVPLSTSKSIEIKSSL
ncbi:MG2 domain-containing protein [Maribacter sp. 2307ULW6-5]|uniref:MG2 domain-containing protein n=1 Tax=Maribacter sp. 2307ULW6-5 TaxID=3386275 RepID=UPI0039BC6676